MYNGAQTMDLDNVRLASSSPSVSVQTAVTILQHLAVRIHMLVLHTAASCSDARPLSC